MILGQFEHEGKVFHVLVERFRSKDFTVMKVECENVLIQVLKSLRQLGMKGHQALTPISRSVPADVLGRAKE